MYPFYFIYYSIRILYIAFIQLKISERRALLNLMELEQTLDGKFDAAVIKKVARYQSIQLHFVANNFSKLNNRLNNKAEAKRNLLFFLMSVLYDEIIDENKMDEASINQLLLQPEIAKPTQFNELALIYIHQQLLNEVEDKESYLDALYKTHDVQKESKKQFNASTPIEDILRITLQKGGYTLLMCRHYISTPSNQLVDDCWYHLGGLIQMTNDLFDTYKDTQAGIYTFANKIKKIDVIIEMFNQQVTNFNTSINLMPYNKFKKIEFAINLALIPSFGYIAIKQLEKLKSSDNTLPNFKKVDRKHLIVDMETWGYEEELCC